MPQPEPWGPRACPEGDENSSGDWKMRPDEKSSSGEQQQLLPGTNALSRQREHQRSRKIYPGPGGKALPSDGLERKPEGTTPGPGRSLPLVR